MKFCQEFEERFGSHVHILDWALHMDEGTPHIQERHVLMRKTGMESCVPSRKKRWRNWGYRFPIRTSQKENTITEKKTVVSEFTNKADFSLTGGGKVDEIELTAKLGYGFSHTKTVSNEVSITTNVGSDDLGSVSFQYYNPSFVTEIV